MRSALALAVDQGRGRDAATLYNNLAVIAWMYEGPRVALVACQEGLEFCERRGMAEWVQGIAAMRLTFLAASGQPEPTLRDAEPLAAKLEEMGSGDVVEVRSAQIRLLAQRGEHRSKTVEAADAI